MSTKKLDPTSIIIFGGTGNLFQKKLLPALLDLYNSGQLPEPFRIVGFARKDYTNDEYRAFVRQTIENEDSAHSKELTTSFLEKLFYCSGDIEAKRSYKKLDEELKRLDETNTQCPNRLFYLAIPPSLYGTIFQNICNSGIAREKENAWVRLLVEKPFGSDLKSAQRLDKQLGELFDEGQIFRIDHYLAKDAIQNILTFRFANTLFDASWSHEYIEKVHINLFEEAGVEDRVDFYNELGALRDVGQNHLLQMLALVAMEPPSELTSQELHKRKYKVLESLHCYGEREGHEHVLRGQYDGYRKIRSEFRNSDTETYFLIRAFLNSRRWRGVPFYLESGKALGVRRTEIVIVFKSEASCMWGTKNLHDYKNILTLSITPRQEINIRFWGKKSGLAQELEPRDLSFACGGGEHTSAYQKVLFDCLSGDQTLFTSTSEVEAAWRFIMPIFEVWRTMPLLPYEVGSDGPHEREDFLNVNIKSICK